MTLYGCGRTYGPTFGMRWREGLACPLLRGPIRREGTVTLPLAVLLVAGLAFLLAGIVKGVIGLGLPTVAMGLLVLVTTPAEAAAMLIVPSLVTNVWQLATGPSLTGLVRRLWSMMAGICVGAFAAPGLLARTDATVV
jgi:hypothetical protein